MIKNSDGMPKKCNSKSLFFFILFSPGSAEAEGEVTAM